MQHHPESSYMPEVPFNPLWGQEAPPPPIVPYQDLIAGFPCSELGKIYYNNKGLVKKSRR